MPPPLEKICSAVVVRVLRPATQEAGEGPEALNQTEKTIGAATPARWGFGPPLVHDFEQGTLVAMGQQRFVMGLAWLTYGIRARATVRVLARN